MFNLDLPRESLEIRPEQLIRPFYLVEVYSFLLLI